MIQFHYPGVKSQVKKPKGKFEQIVFQEFLSIGSMVSVSRGRCCKNNVNVLESQIMYSPSFYCAFSVGNHRHLDVRKKQDLHHF